MWTVHRGIRGQNDPTQVIRQIQSVQEGHPSQVIDEHLIFREHNHMLQVDLNADYLLAKLHDHNRFLTLRVPNHQLSLTRPFGGSLSFR